MLIYFKISNYKSIYEEVTINFNASSINEHSQSNLIHDNNTDFLKTILLYGHNASGKSKILDALVYFKWFVNNSATEKNSNEKIDVEPFKFYEHSSNKPSKFEILIKLGSRKYRYGFIADEKKIHNEWLLESTAKKEYPVFLRIDQDFNIDEKRFPNSKDLIVKTRKNSLFLSVASQWNVAKAQEIDKWFDNIITLHGLNDSYYKDDTIKLLKNKKYANVVNSFIQKADIGINSIDVINFPIDIEHATKNIPKPLKEHFKNKLIKDYENTVVAYHKKYNKRKEIIGYDTLLLDKQESEGTNKFFNLIGSIINGLNNNSLVIIDELDSSLHSLLSKAILKLFNSGDLKSKTQLLASTHDTALLDRDILRRDQIYFIEKNEYGETNATSLVEFKVRKESPYDKNYLEGKYGAIPLIDDLAKIFVKKNG